MAALGACSIGCERFQLLDWFANTVLTVSAVRQVRANAETAMDARAAKRFGAQGIGLVRTEHMFFEASFYQSLR